MPYLGDFPAAGGYQVTIPDCPTVAGVTVISIRRDRVSEVESLKLTPDPVTKIADSGVRPIGSNVGRLVIIVSLVSGTATASVNGNSVVLNPDGMATLDIV